MEIAGPADGNAEFAGVDNAGVGNLNTYMYVRNSLNNACEMCSSN